MNSEYTVVPTVAVHPDRIVYYKRFQGTRPRSCRFESENQPPVNHSHGGNVSKKASRKIDRAITYLITCSRTKDLHSWKHQQTFPFKLAFITLTLPSSQLHKNGVLMSKCFRQFLIEAGQKWKVHNYVWRAERQKNGNIHWHVLVDRFVPWSELRDVWNRITNKLGYVDRYRDEMKKFHQSGMQIRADLIAKWNYKSQVKAYRAGIANDWRSPNSTDVHAVKKVKNIKAYVCKYMMKSSQSDSEITRLWGCSYELSRAKGAILELDSRISNAIEFLRRKFKPLEVTHDHFSIIFIDWWHMARAGIDDLFLPLQSYVMELFHHRLAIGI